MGDVAVARMSSRPAEPEADAAGARAAAPRAACDAALLARAWEIGTLILVLVQCIFVTVITDSQLVLT